MANAIFHANLTYTPPASNTVSQAFNVQLSYSAVSLGTIQVAKESEAQVDIPFGGAKAAHGVVVRNNLDVAVKVRINGCSKVTEVDGSTVTGLDLYEISSGGMLMHWSPESTTNELSVISLTPSEKTTNEGTIEYIVLGG